MFDKRCRSPVHITMTDITHEIRQQKRAVFAVIYLWVELYTPCRFALDMKSRRLYFMGTGHKGKGRGNYRNRIDIHTVEFSRTPRMRGSFSSCQAKLARPYSRVSADSTFPPDV